jgi:hypothetical protein
LPAHRLARRTPAEAVLPTRRRNVTDSLDEPPISAPLAAREPKNLFGGDEIHARIAVFVVFAVPFPKRALKRKN